MRRTVIIDFIAGRIAAQRSFIEARVDLIVDAYSIYIPNG